MTGVTERAILAGGCFWGMQDLLRRFPGVISTRVGYSGGDVPNATYRNHGTHAEAIEIIFEPEKTSFRDLLEFFFQIHDPSTKNRQGNDLGLSYRSAIFYTTDEQRQVAEDTIADVDASGLWPGKVVTELAPAGDFWEAEPEHQDYLERFRTATPATSSARAGSCHAAATLRKTANTWQGSPSGDLHDRQGPDYSGPFKSYLARQVSCQGANWNASSCSLASLKTQFPRLEPRNLIPPSGTMLEPQSNTRPLILVVEDEVLVRIILVDVLEDAGYQVIEAIHADEAISILRALSGVDALITDVEMPQGSMNGFEMAQRVRTVCQDIEILISSRTGHSQCRRFAG